MNHRTLSGMVRGAALAALFAGSLAAAPSAQAFCGFYVAGSNEKLVNNATQVALMRDGTRTVLTMSNNYQGPPENFAMVVPVPIVLQKENVKTLPLDVFTHLESLTAPRLVEYWERDPCAPPDPQLEMDMGAVNTAAPPVPTTRATTNGVKIEAQFVVGEYEIVILSATESTGLETWLKDNHYNIPDGAAEALAPYIREQSKFFVARVDITKVARKPDGTTALSPLRFHYDTPDFKLPVRLGLLNAPDAQDLLVYILHKDKRFELTNYPNVTIPTNLDVTDAVRTQFPSFYATLFDRTVQQSGGRAIVTEYAWATNSCDPCPTPPLEDSELATLGTDALPNAGDMNSYQMTVTRLHARYSKATLTEDLVFKETGAIVGGREFLQDANGGLERGARPAEYGGNNFQARYAIRHAWRGDIKCEKPVRGVWQGPPAGQEPPKPSSATGLANATRGGVELAQVVLTSVPSLGIAVSAPNPGAKTDAGTPAPATADAGAPAASKPPTPPATPATPATTAPPPAKKSCGCDVPGHGRPATGLLAALAGLALVAGRRRAR